MDRLSEAAQLARVQERHTRMLANGDDPAEVAYSFVSGAHGLCHPSLLLTMLGESKTADFDHDACKGWIEGFAPS